MMKTVLMCMTRICRQSKQSAAGECVAGEKRLSFFAKICKGMLLKLQIPSSNYPTRPARAPFPDYLANLPFS